MMDYLSKGDLRSYLLQLKDERYACVHYICRICLYVYVAIVHVIFMCLHAACKLACVSVQV